MGLGNWVFGVFLANWVLDLGFGVLKPNYPITKKRGFPADFWAKLPEMGVDDIFKSHLTQFIGFFSVVNHVFESEMA